MNKLKFRESGDALGTEYHGTIKAYMKAKYIGYISYSYYQKITAVKMIEVLPIHRRKGIGLKLLNKLQEDSETPIIIQGNVTTSDGQSLWAKFKQQREVE